MLNKQMIIGNLGSDPELRYTQSGDAVANLSVATTKTWKDKDGNKQEKTTWHRVVLFKQKAEFAANYLKKGSKVYVEGETDHRKWQDQDGNDKYTTEVHAFIIQNLSPREESQGGSGGGFPEPPQGGFGGGGTGDDVPFAPCF